jgi:hypothetical protein
VSDESRLICATVFQPHATHAFAGRAMVGSRPICEQNPKGGMSVRCHTGTQGVDVTETFPTLPQP